MAACRAQVLKLARALNRVQSVRCCSTRSPALTALPEEDVMMRDMATKFAREKIQPLVIKMDEDEKFDPGMIKDLFENGFMGLEIPEEFGGAGTSFFQSLLVIEEISRVDPTVGILVDIQNTLINALISSLGTKAQREKYLPRLAQQTAGSFCLSEPESGSDAFAMKTPTQQQP
ncbi:unnamed protein product [Notodromas monacha]|uniref:Short/branched chain specific acyl-CoA dehydrogenase, mitochondrial n=1 Tax=Notodromas monacha TaxID=399045 RepID=A0A7R9BPG0_9CRUS|nr:unnamed protein product [Notodromas monacha]CAG0917756.1 unnamed protein product [Notodromas monacha]